MADKDLSGKSDEAEAPADELEAPPEAEADKGSEPKAPDSGDAQATPEVVADNTPATTKAAEEAADEASDDEDVDELDARAEVTKSPTNKKEAPAEAGSSSHPDRQSSSPPPSSSSSSPKSGGSNDNNNGGGGNSNTFYTLFESIQTNIEAVNAAAKVVEQINDRFLFRGSTISREEESSLIQQVDKLVTSTNIKARDTSRLVQQLRRETAKPDPAAGSESKSENEKSPEEKEEESRDVGDRENICKSITRSFTDELLLYQSAIQDFKNELKERLHKKVQSIKPTASEDFIDLSLRSESSRFALFREIMSVEEKDMSEEDARAFKDDIAEKYLMIADLSRGSHEMNKLFLKLRSTNINTDTDSDDDNKKPAAPTTDTDSPTNVDPLFGRRVDGGGNTGVPPFPGLTKDPESDKRKEMKDSQHRNRVLSFINRHRRGSSGRASFTSPTASTTGSSDSQQQPRASFVFDGAEKPRGRGARARRWMMLFMLATVAIAALMGIVMLH